MYACSIKQLQLLSQSLIWVIFTILERNLCLKSIKIYTYVYQLFQYQYIALTYFNTWLKAEYAGMGRLSSSAPTIVSWGRILSQTALMLWITNDHNLQDFFLIVYMYILFKTFITSLLVTANQHKKCYNYCQQKAFCN